METSGFSHTDADAAVLLPENPGSKELATEKGTKPPEGATAGAGSGAAIGGTLVGGGALAIRGLGPFIAAGPVLSALAGARADGAVGGVTEALISLRHSRKRSQGYGRET